MIHTQLDWIKQVAWVADEKKLAIGTKLWSTVNGRESGTLPRLGVAWSPDGCRFTDGFSIYDAASGKVIAPLQDQHEYNPAGTVAWSPDGRSIAISGNGVQIKVWDAVSGKRVYTLQGRIAGSIAFSPDSRRLAAADFLGTITIWEATPPRETAIFADHAANVQCVAFHPGNRLVASADRDQNIRVWDVATRRTVQALTVATPSISKFMFRGAYGLAFSGDGARLAAGCVNGTVKVWDAKTWQMTAGLKGLEDATWHEAAVAFQRRQPFPGRRQSRKSPRLGHRHLARDSQPRLPDGRDQRRGLAAPGPTVGLHRP